MSALAAVLTTFFDAADNAYLPTVVGRAGPRRANGALAASGSATEFAAFGIAGFLVKLLTAPIAIAIDALSFLVSAVLLGTIRRPEPPPPPASEREPVLDEIREGLRLVVRDPVLRGLALGHDGPRGDVGRVRRHVAPVRDRRLELDPAVIGVVAGAGRLRSLFGALLAERVVGRSASGASSSRRCCSPPSATCSSRSRRRRCRWSRSRCLIGQQLDRRPAVTVFDVTEVSVRQSRVGDRQLGRVNATVRVAMVMAQLVATLVGGVLAEVIGLRGAAFLAPVFALLGAWLLFRSTRAWAADHRPVAGEVAASA